MIQALFRRQILKTDRKKNSICHVKEMSAEQATEALRAKNLNIKIDGTKGIVSSQEPTYETEVEEGTIINVVIKEKLNGAQ